MSTENEILNIEYHRRRLCLKALNIHKTYTAAAEKLGVSERNLRRLAKDYGFWKDGLGYYYEQKKTNR